VGQGTHAMLGKESEDSRPGFALAEVVVMDGDPAPKAFFKIKKFSDL